MIKIYYKFHDHCSGYFTVAVIKPCDQNKLGEERIIWLRVLIMEDKVRIQGRKENIESKAGVTKEHLLLACFPFSGSISFLRQTSKTCLRVVPLTAGWILPHLERSHSHAHRQIRQRQFIHPDSFSLVMLS